MYLFAKLCSQESVVMSAEQRDVTGQIIFSGLCLGLEMPSFVIQLMNLVLGVAV
jgi:hypothetical protein